MAYLPRSIRTAPSFKSREIPLGSCTHNKKNAFGARSFWSFFPGTYGSVSNPEINNTDPSYLSNGQPLVAELRREQAFGALGFSVSPYSGDSLGYNGLVANFFNQQASGGWEYSFGSGSQGQIAWPNKQSLTLWALFKPLGDGSQSQVEDPRILSRDDGTGTSNHYYMIGGVRSGGAVRARMRFKVNGTTQTVVVTSQDWQNDGLNFIAATYDGSNLTLHHIREDGGYGTANISATGDITDSTSSGVGLSLGGNFVADNAFEGEILGAGAFDYAENNQFRLLNFRNDIGQILKPLNDQYYFVPAGAPGGLVVQDLSAATSLTSPTLTQNNALSVNDLAVATLLTQPVLGQNVNLSADDLSAGTSLTEPALSQNNNLSVDDLAASSALTSPAFTQHNALSVDTLAVASSLTEPVFVQQNILVVDDLNSLSALSSPVFVQQNALSVDDLASASSLTNVTLGIAGVLSVANLNVATQLTSPVFDQHNILVVDSLAVSSSLSNVSLVGSVSLAVNDLAVGTTISQVTLDAVLSLLVNDLAVVSSLTSPNLDQHNILLVDDMSVNTLLSIVSFGGAVISCLSGYVTIQPVLSGSTTIKPTLSGNVKID